MDKVMFAEESIIPKLCLELTSSSKPKRRDKLPPESILYDRLIGYFSMTLINFSNAGLDFDKTDKVVKLYSIWKKQMTHDSNIWKSMASKSDDFHVGFILIRFLKLFRRYPFFKQLKKSIFLASKKELRSKCPSC